MGQFYLIDQSLKGMGGHHYDYTHLLAEAALAAEWSVVIGCHRKFPRDVFPVPSGSHAELQIRNIFRHTTYARCSSLVGIQEMVHRRRRSPLDRLLRAIGLAGDGRRQRERERERRIEAFRRDCEALFDRPLTRGDLIFFTTLSDLEVEGLYRFLRQRADARLANWHLQFHFPLFLGRTADYESQLENLEGLSPGLRKLKSLADTRVRFHVTSDTLRQQYERTGFEFHELPYPVNPRLRLAASPATGDDLQPPEVIRLTIAGAIRGEKGGSGVDALLSELEREIETPFCLRVQRKRPKLLQRLRNRFQPPAESPHLEVHGYPLDNTDYRSLVTTSSIGLLTTYDSRTYFARRAGILGEYLSAGVPVIVPAGCWLADQVEREQRRYLRDILSHHALHQRPLQPRSTATQSTGRTIASFDASRTGGNSSSDKTLYILQFDAIEPSTAGHYFRVRLQVPDGTSGAEHDQVIGRDPSTARQLVAFYLPGNLADSGGPAAELSLEISPAFGGSRWQIENISLTQVTGAKPLPRSVVGLVAAEVSQTAALTNEMIAHYSHYRRSAVAFAEQWFARHDPRVTFQTLVNDSDFSQSRTRRATSTKAA